VVTLFIYRRNIIASVALLAAALQFYVLQQSTLMLSMCYGHLKLVDKPTYKTPGQLWNSELVDKMYTQKSCLRKYKVLCLWTGCKRWFKSQHATTTTLRVANKNELLSNNYILVYQIKKKDNPVLGCV